MLKIIPLINAGIIIGIVLFQSLLVAPGINELISTKEASIFLRFIWPKFFIVLGIISIISFIILTIKNKIQNLPKVFFIISFLLMLTCYIITPFINEAKDTNNEMLWSTLHLLTIFFTLITLVLNFLTIIYWKFESKSI
tara:strand:+ start:10916 stop:11332 length:417 start_codon:yes stop_codon:yes gene_type:complete